MFIVATPIGHLEDLSARALKTLNSVDAILCEDTRRTSILLDRYSIHKPLISYHKFKEKASLESILNDLTAGRQLALVSDAGTPCINDPGQILVAACRERGLALTAIPGPCSVVQALVLSGFETSRFQFIGFLPKSPKKALLQALAYPGTTVAFESPERLSETLELLPPDAQVAVLREMTKAFEECKRGTAAEVGAHFKAHPPKGEIALVLPGHRIDSELSVEELVDLLQELHGLSLKEAIKEAARLKKVPKRDVYKKFHRD